METDLQYAVLSCAEMAAADRRTISAGTPGSVLMEKAGAGVAQSILQTGEPCRTAILCGPGNNAGDGYVVARHLAAEGWDVSVFATVSPDELIGDAAAAAAQWTGPITVLKPGESETLLTGSEIIIDALFGTGLARPLEGVAQEAAQAANAMAALRVSVDIPSGLSGDTGQIVGGENGTVFDAHMTVTFFRKKRGHLLYPGRALSGEVLVVPIGIDPGALSVDKPPALELSPPLFVSDMRPHTPMAHKYDRGHALVCGGGSATTGAARLAARATLRTGAGLVTTAFPAEALAIYAAQQTAVMNAPYDDVSDFRDILDSKRRNAILIGPGHGVDENTRRAVEEVLLTGKPALLDADALSVFAEEPDALFKAISGPCVLTPHMGEFKRIFPDLDAAADKISAVRKAARRAGCTVLLKGPDTVIAAADGRTVIDTHAPPTLATAGSGDVLAGMIIGLVAQGMDVFDAAMAGVWLHGEAARLLERVFIAEDLVEAIPAALASLSQQ